MLYIGMSSASIGSSRRSVRPDPARRSPAACRRLLAQDADRPRPAAGSGGPRPMPPRSTRTPCSRPSPRRSRPRSAATLHDPKRSCCRSPTSRRPTRSASTTGSPVPCSPTRRTGPATEAERRAAAAKGQDRGDTPSGVLRSRTALNDRRRRRTPARSSARPRPRPGRERGRAGPTIGSKAPQRADPAVGSRVGPPSEAELHELTTVTRPAIVARIVAARELGDLKENSDYHEARREQSFAEGRIQAIEDLLRHVEIIEEGADDGSGPTRLDGRGRGTARRRGDVHPRRLDRGQPGCRSDLGQLADRRGAPRRSGRRRGRGDHPVRADAVQDSRGSLRRFPRSRIGDQVARRGAVILSVLAASLIVAGCSSSRPASQASIDPNAVRLVASGAAVHHEGRLGPGQQALPDRVREPDRRSAQPRRSPLPDADPVFRSEVFPGPATKTFAIQPLAAGSYIYQAATSIPGCRGP